MLDINPLRIVVTGGGGFLGRWVCCALLEQGCQDVCAPPRTDYDLRNQQQTHKLFFDYSPDVVIHLAARCGGIGANRAAPAEFFFDNLMMGAHVIDCASRFGVRRLVLVGTACSYPQAIGRPILERDLWAGYPEPTNAPYGIAKRCLGTMLQAYHAQYGLPAAYVIPANLYGPGDNFDPATSHVIPAMIRRFSEAARTGQYGVTCWGTGSATRDFLYVADAARGIVQAAQLLDDAQPVNLGTGSSVTMRDLADKVALATGYCGHIAWDSSMPDGQPVRIVGTERSWSDWQPRFSLPEGLRLTAQWWKENGHLRPAA